MVSHTLSGKGLNIMQIYAPYYRQVIPIYILLLILASRATRSVPRPSIIYYHVIMCAACVIVCVLCIMIIVRWRMVDLVVLVRRTYSMMYVRNELTCKSVTMQNCPRMSEPVAVVMCVRLTYGYQSTHNTPQTSRPTASRTYEYIVVHGILYKYEIVHCMV